LIPLPDDSFVELEEWHPIAPDRRSCLLLKSLRESHATDSPLWEWWERWKTDRRDYQKALGDLRGRVTIEMENLKDSYEASSLVTTDYFFKVLLERSISISRDIPIYDPSMLNVIPEADLGNGEKGDGLFLGTSGILVSARDVSKDLIEDKPRILKEVSDIMVGMVSWTEVETMKKLFQEMADLKDRIEEEIEVLTLRRAFPGRCRLCPV
jgi:hypothetical protein